MKITELRLKNLIKYKSTGDIDTIKKLVLPKYQEESDSFGDIEPIPLSGEWLERFGFELALGSKTIWFLKNEDIEISLVLDNENFSVVIDSQYRFPFKRKIEHVHQLQNLYFALTGKELENKITDIL